VPLLTTALDLCSQIGDRHHEAALHNNLADLYHAAGEPDKSMEHFKQAAVIFTEIGKDKEGRYPETWMVAEW
jgi:hypothetical protein